MSNSMILASGSPRRKDLLSAVGLTFEICIPEIDETPLKKETPGSMVKRLSEQKAKAVLGHLPPLSSERFIVSADTTVVSPRGAILGKPASHQEAVQMLSALQGKEHTVLTGYTILKLTKSGKTRMISRVIKTRVKIQALDASDIEAYIARGESMDKAGAYAAQGMGMAIIEGIRGSYTNVVGLPVAELLRDLKKLGWKRK